MKIKIETTIDIDAKQVRAYLKELGTDDIETVREFVTSNVLCVGIGCLEERLSSSGYELLS